MKAFFALSILFVLVLAPNGYVSAKEDAPPRTLVKVSENVYTYEDIKNSTPQKSYGANAGIIIGQEGVVVIDTLISSKEAVKFINDILQITDKPIKYVINTHYHLDHAFGNNVFTSLGAIVISHEKDSENLRNSFKHVMDNAEGYGLSKKDIEGTVAAYPEITFSDKLSIDIGSETVKLQYLGHTHSGGSIVVILPKQKILFAGDILFTAYHPFLGEGDIVNWTNALDTIARMDVDTIIPGHGPVSTKNDLKDMKQYLLAFDKEARKLAAGSSDIENITKELLKLLPKRPEGTGLIPMNLKMKYLKD